MGLATRGALLGTAIALVVAPAAGAEVFWANKYQDAIGHAGSDGGSPDNHFIPLDANSRPVGVAQDAGHVYWTSYEAPDAIGRAALDGGDLRQAFITGASDPVGLAVDGAHVYWTNSSAGSIGRANLVGGDVTQRFITGLSRPYGLAVDGGHIYWSGETDGTIGRANLDGTCQEPSFMRVGGSPTALAVDGAHIYWADHAGESLGRANLDGTGAVARFIDLAGELPWGVAVDGAHLYWSEQMPRAIGRSLDGDVPDPAFVPAAGEGIYGVSVRGASTAASGHTSCAPASQPDRAAPVLSRLILSRSTFAAAASGPAVARARVGARLRYTVSEPAVVRFTVRRRHAGRKVRGRCRARTRRNRSRPRCDRPLRGTIAVYAPPGVNRMTFRGRLRGRRLRPGLYVLAATATDAAGNQSAPTVVRFRIRRPPRARRRP